jgi:hypothetical protein
MYLGQLHACKMYCQWEDILEILPLVKVKLTRYLSKLRRVSLDNPVGVPAQAMHSYLFLEGSSNEARYRIFSL